MKKVAIVTGASSGIGFQTALALAEEGFDIAALSLHDEDGFKRLTAEITARGREIKCYDFDLKLIEHHEQIVKRVLDAFGRVDCLVNNAGVSVLKRGDLLEMTPESYDRCFDVNTRGTFFLSQCVAKHMVAQSPLDSHRSIVFVTSSNAVAATVERGEYCMAKTALSMAAKLFAIRMAPHGVGVYEVQPGLILTEMTVPSKEKYDKLIAQGMTLDQRWGLPQDVARVIRTMASGLLPYTVGQDVRVDGGLLMTRF